MSGLTRDGTVEPVSRDQILRRERGQGNRIFPCSADHGQDWQPYLVDLYSASGDYHTHIHTYSPSSCVTPAGTSNELDVQNEWEENTHTHTHTKRKCQRYTIQ